MTKYELKFLKCWQIERIENCDYELRFLKSWQIERVKSDEIRVKIFEVLALG